MQEFVSEAYFVIQESWKNNDIKKASSYIMPDLLEQFQIKLNWMEMQKKKNIMDKIELIDVYPVTFNDDSEDKKDYVWFYIKGKMIDYIIDNETSELIEGSLQRKSFIEYWQFKKIKIKNGH